MVTKHGFTHLGDHRTRVFNIKAIESNACRSNISKKTWIVQRFLGSKSSPSLNWEMDEKKAIVAEMDGINHQNMGHWGDDCFTNMVHDWHFSQGLKDDIWSVFSEMFCLPGWWSGSIAGPPESTFFQPGFTTHHLAPLPVVSVLRQHQVGRLWACSMV